MLSGAEAVGPPPSRPLGRNRAPAELGRERQFRPVRL